MDVGVLDQLEQRVEHAERDLAQVRATLREFRASGALRPVSQAVAEWAQRINEAINAPALTADQRRRIVHSVPGALRHAVAAECYRTNVNVTFGWVAAIADVLALDVPALLQAHGVEPDLSASAPATADEMDATWARYEELRRGRSG